MLHSVLNERLARLLLLLVGTLLLALVLSQPAGAGRGAALRASGRSALMGSSPPSPLALDLKVHDANRVRLAVTNTGQIGNNPFTGQDAGTWPAGTRNNYIFGSGIAVAGIADVNGDGAADSAVTYGYDTLSGGTECQEGRVGQDPDDPATRVFSSLIVEDLTSWPLEFWERYDENGNGTPNERLVYSVQDFVTVYNGPSRPPMIGVGNLPVEIHQRSMAFLGGRATNAIVLIFDIINRSDSLPWGPFPIEDAYVAYIADVDIGDEFSDDQTGYVPFTIDPGGDTIPLGLGMAWDRDFSETNFTGKVGFVGVKYLLTPGNPSDGIDNDGDGLVDESPWNGVDDDGDGTIDEVPDEADQIGVSGYSLFNSPSIPGPRPDPQVEEESYRLLACLGGECFEGPVRSDIRFLLSAGPFDLGPGETQRVAFAILFAEPVGDPDHLDMSGEPPRPDPNDPALTEFIQTALELQEIFDGGFLDLPPAPFEILDTSDLPDTNDPTTPHTVRSVISDSVGIARVTLFYAADGDSFFGIPMNPSYGVFWEGTAPPHPFGTTVRYFVEAVDSAYEVVRDPENAPLSTFDFEVVDAPHFASAWSPVIGGRGVAWADYDGDGLLDFYLVGIGPASREGHLFRGLGGGAFEDVTEAAQAGVVGNPQAAAFGDYDNDGAPDLAVGNLAYDESLVLLRNQGDGTFTDATAEAGLPDSLLARGVLWGDYDRDGGLDLFAVASRQDRLLRNVGDGTFRDVTADAGLTEDLNGISAAFLDYDGDRDLDLVVLNTSGNVLYRNDGDGTFTDASGPSFVGAIPAAGTVSIGDYDRDGYPDLLLSHGTTSTLARNRRNGTFVNVAEEAGVAQAEGASAFLDVTGDGWEDLYIGGELFVNNQDGTFADRTAFSRIVEAFDAVAPADWDGDGQIDLYAGRLVENLGYPAGVVRHWLEVRLAGVDSPRDGTGARVEVWVGGQRMTGWALQGVGDSQGSPILHFGLGEAAVVDSLTIWWPSGIRQDTAWVAADQVIRLVEHGIVVAVEDEPPTGSPVLPRAFAFAAAYPNPFNPRVTLPFAIPAGAGEAEVRLRVYSLRGELVKTLVDGSRAPGSCEVMWDGRDERGMLVPSGIYLARLEAGPFRAVRKLVLLR